jgi:hypothetical protein
MDMKSKKIVIGIVAVALLTLMLSSATLLATVKAAPWPNLPLTQVQLTVVDGTTSYFVSTLSGVPATLSGVPAEFDVHNGVYPGWCVDTSVTMIRSVSHNVKLYSSSPPAALNSIDWIAINYILNHKQGTMMDVQEAIWYFTNDLSTISATAQAMVDAANAKPSYDPTTGAILAVICLPQDDPAVQNTIIELSRPSGLSPGFWKHNIGVRLGLRNGAYSSPYEGFGPITTEFLNGLALPAPWTLQTAYNVLNTGGGGAVAQARLDMANIFNTAAGFGMYVD